MHYRIAIIFYLLVHGNGLKEIQERNLDLMIV